MELMTKYHWPGNIRELENAIQRALIMSEGEFITPADLSLIINSNSIDNIRIGEMSLEELEKKVIINTLKKVKGNRTKAAEILGISVKTIRNKIKKYHIG